MTPERTSPNRRDFLQTTAAGLAAAAAASSALAQGQTARTNAGGIPLRPLGRTGEIGQPALPRRPFQHQSQEALRVGKPPLDPAGR